MSPNAIPTNSGGPIPSRIIDVGSVGSYTTWGISMIHQLLWTQTDTCIFRIEIVQTKRCCMQRIRVAHGLQLLLILNMDLNQSSIGLDSNNNVHIVHLESDEYRLRYTTNMSGSWFPLG